MILKSRNKRLVVELASKTVINDRENTFIIPDKIKKQNTENEIYYVLDRSEDCTIPINIGSYILIEGNMIEESRVSDQVFLTVKENFVIGVLKDM